ncbi:MAG: insulinase family protein [Rubrivivax sp.]|nr:insulinase family protein [Rubrivivax sp.]
MPLAKKLLQLPLQAALNVALAFTLTITLTTTLAGPARAQAAPAEAAAALPAVPPRDPAPGDLAQWRRLVLPNGIKAMLLSDPKLNVSSASLAVGVGSLADPPARQGLAHFLEHMLFLGTEKYPDITGFDAYLRRNSGFNNAYTAEDRTNFHFEIRHAAFEGALDRFAQFFIAPLFDARYTEREMNAVASEHQKNLENDLWREQQVQVQAYAVGHPARHFGTGSKTTLAGVTRDELLAFYRSEYSAGRMTLALTGNASLDQLEHWARQYFAAVPDRALPALVYPSDYLPHKAALRMLRMEPIKDLRQLSLQFPLPGLYGGWPNKSAELLGYLFGSEGPGSLLAQLKAEGLATSLSAGAQPATRQYGAMELQIGLTPSGLKQVPRVLALVFSAARMLREQGLPPQLFKEWQTLARLDERFRDRGEGANLATGLANAAMDYPLPLAERVPYLWLQPDPAAFNALLSRIRPDNLLVTVVAKGQPTDRVEPIYGTRYSYSEDSGAAYAALLQPPVVAAIHTPPPNPFIPAHTTQQALQPARLIDEPTLSLYHLQDSEFQRPQAAMLMRQRLPRSLVTSAGAAQTSVLLRYYQACVNEALNQTTYQAAEAGQRFQLSASLDGVALVIEGWDEAGARLLDAVAPRLIDFDLSAERFADIKDRLLRGLSAYDNADAYVSVRETRRALVREFYATPAEMLPLARTVTLDQVRAFARQLYAQGKLEALAFGNLGPTDAQAAVRRVAQRLNTQPVADTELLRGRQLVMGPGQDLRSSERLKVNNSTLRREYVLGDDSPELRAATMLISAVIADPFYSEMRTRQQLGYIVQANAFVDEQQTEAMFIIQSGEYSADQQEARAEAFIRTLPAQLQALPDEAWATIVAGVRSHLLERDKSIAERAQRLYLLAYERHADWARNQATLAALDSLSKARVGEILARALDPATRRMRNFQGFARQHKPEAAPVVSFSDRADWKKVQRYE